MGQKSSSHSTIRDYQPALSAQVVREHAPRSASVPVIPQATWGTSPGPAPSRPNEGSSKRGNTWQTRYVEMLVSQYEIPRLNNILASFFGWLLLAGFVVLPGTFTSIQELSTEHDLAEANEFLHSVQNLPLVIIAAIVCGLGALGLLWLAFCWRKNYVWLLNRIFLPGATNAAAGLISTFIGVYAQKPGGWSVMAKVTVFAEAGVLLVCGALCVLSTLMMQSVRHKHAKEMNMLEEEPLDERILEKTRRKLRAPAVEPLSVV